jgi:undecaprenyl-diphosphatase
MTRAGRNVAGLAVGIGTLLGTAVLARRPRSQTEIRIFRAANNLPTRAYPAIWIPMQYGTFGTVPAAAVVALARGRPRLSMALGAGGTAAWILAKIAKAMVSRGRPASIIEHVAERGSEEADQGFPSGHAAVSASLTVVAWPQVPMEWRLGLTALAGFVPFARMYVGAHLPLDVVGGSALGLAAGCAINLAFPIQGDRAHASVQRPARGTPRRRCRA